MTFQQGLSKLRKLRRSFSAYDAALVFACVRILDEAAATAEEQRDERNGNVSMRVIANYLAHRELAERTCARYSLTFLVPNKVFDPVARTGVVLPSIERVPNQVQLAKLDQRLRR